MNKILKIFLIVLSAIAALVLICLGLYSIGYLDVFIIFLLIPGTIIASLVCFALNLVSVVRLKRKGEPVPRGKKLMLGVMGAIFGCLLMFVIALIAVFAMAIAFM